MLVAALALSLLAACSTATDAGDKSADAKADKGKSSTNPATAGGAADNGADKMGVDQPDPSKAIFSRQFAIPGNPAHKVTVGILSLERMDRVAILKVVVTPEFSDLPASELIKFTKALELSGQFWMPRLLDLTNLKEYQVLYGDGKWLNFQEGEAVSGQPIYG